VWQFVADLQPEFFEAQLQQSQPKAVPHELYRSPKASSHVLYPNHSQRTACAAHCNSCTTKQVADSLHAQ
jgi:hypothetical protein